MRVDLSMYENPHRSYAILQISELTYFPFFPSHNFTDLSKEALATSLVSGENRTSLMSCWCPVILVTGFLSSSGCHRYRVKSSEPETRRSDPAPYEKIATY